MVKTIARTLAFAAIAAPVLAFAADGGNFRNGNSYFGEPADGTCMEYAELVTNRMIERHEHYSHISSSTPGRSSATRVPTAER